jgi:hypothetical protein
VLNPSTGKYEFCTVYEARDAGEACVRLWVDWTDTSCDPEVWWRFNQACNVESSLPPNCAIDARYPTGPDGRTPAGWDAVEFTFNGVCDMSALGPDDFVSTIPIDAVVAQGNVVTVQLARVIPAGEWTCIDHAASDTTVCIGSLPGDVGSDRTSNAADVLELIDELNTTRPPPPLEIWQCDVDRSGACIPADVLGVIDMLNAGWNNRTLPACPAGP